MTTTETTKDLIQDIIQYGSELIRQTLQDDQHVINGIKDMVVLTSSYYKIAGKILRGFADSPESLFKLMLDTLSGKGTVPALEPLFKSALWQTAPYMHYKQYYENFHQALTLSIVQMDFANDFTKQQAIFITRVFLEFITPKNFILFNPELLALTKKQKGFNLLRGLRNLIKDLTLWHGYFNVTRCPYDKFIPGDNIATTPGDVIYQNDLIELLAYHPQTEKVTGQPLLIVTSWINKYYILDLRKQNSLIKWLTEQGLQVFTLSWRMPDKTLQHYDFADYVEQGVLTAINQIAQYYPGQPLHLFGYCLGGTLTACAAAYLAKTNPQQIQSLSLIASMIDFTHSGEMRKLLGDEQIQAFENSMRGFGIWDGRKMAAAFNLINTEHYYWPFQQRHYWQGEAPIAHELVHWLQDYTHTPEKLFRFYMRALYRDNLLVKPNAFSLKGIGIDFSAVHCPVYCLGLLDDHLTPAPAAFANTQLFPQARFLLGEGGHVAGTLSTPTQKKLGYFVNEQKHADLATWQSHAQYQSGSWWLDWLQWFTQQHSSLQQPNQPFSVLRTAPGSYVRAMAVAP